MKNQPTLLPVNLDAGGLPAFAVPFMVCGFHAIWTLSPPTSGHPFHDHPDRQSERSDAGSHC